MLICITGINGAGKSTQVNMLQSLLQSMNHSVFVSKAYGTDEKASFEAFLTRWHDLTITLAFQGLYHEQCARALDALRMNKVVIADRWDESYLAYHLQFGYLSHNHDLRDSLNQLSFQGIKPDLTFLIDVPANVARARMRARGKMGFFDSKGPSHHEAMRRAYAQLAHEFNWHVLDGEKPPEILHAIISEFVITQLSNDH